MTNWKSGWRICEPAAIAGNGTLTELAIIFARQTDSRSSQSITNSQLLLVYSQAMIAVPVPKHVVSGQFMTASAIKGGRENCLTGGMDDFSFKPIKSAELFKTAGTFAGQKDKH